MGEYKIRPYQAVLAKKGDRLLKRYGRIQIHPYQAML